MFPLDVSSTHRILEVIIAAGADRSAVALRNRFQTSNPAVGNFLEFAALFYSFQTSRCFGTGLALITVRKKISPMRSENPFLAALVLIGTSLLARMAAQGVKQALFSTAMEYCLNARRRKLRSARSGW